MMISVVIPAFNEEANIGACLSALAAQTLRSNEFEVILVDNGSTDGTFETASRFKHLLQLRMISQPRTSISAARNRGASVADSPVLAFLDADCITRPNWLQNSLSVAQPKTLWGAHYLVQQDASWVGTTWFRFQATEEEGPVSFLPGSCLFLYRRDFEILGGFEASMTTSEDVDLSYRARRLGFKVLAYPALSVFHEGTPRTLAGFFRQNRWHGRNVLPNFIANLPSMQNLGIVALTLHTLVMIGFLPLALALAFWLHLWILPIVALLGLVLPPAMLSAVRTTRANALTSSPALFVLYLVYLVARAAAVRSFILRPRVPGHNESWRHTQHCNARPSHVSGVEVSEGSPPEPLLQDPTI